MAQQLAVLGAPISHSRSPRIHAAAYRALDLDWRYSTVRCGTSDLDRFLSGRDDTWRGLSLTMPLKEGAYRAARIRDRVAEESGIANTLLRLAGNAGWAAFNTDVLGLARAVAGAGLSATHTVVFGSGATAVSAVLAARSLGAELVTVVARNASAVADIVRRFTDTAEHVDGSRLRVHGVVWDAQATAAHLAAGGEAIDPDIAPGELPPTLVISTLPGTAAASFVPPTHCAGVALTEVPLFDVAYHPWPSSLALMWELAGGRAVAGTEMLVEQALIQVRIFVGGDPQAMLSNEPEVLAAMRAAVA